MYVGGPDAWPGRVQIPQFFHGAVQGDSGPVRDQPASVRGGGVEASRHVQSYPVIDRPLGSYNVPVARVVQRGRQVKRLVRNMANAAGGRASRQKRELTVESGSRYVPYRQQAVVQLDACLPGISGLSRPWQLKCAYPWT